MAIKIKPIVDSAVTARDRLNIQQPPFGGITVSAPVLTKTAIVKSNTILPR